MSLRSSSKATNKREYSSDTLDSTTRRENFNKLRSIFEIRRPSKSPNSTLTKSKSYSSLNILSSDEEKYSSKDSLFMRTNSVCSNNSLPNKYKRKSTGQTSKRKDDKKKEVFGNIENSDTLIAALEKQLKKQNEYISPSHEKHFSYKTDSKDDQNEDQTSEGFEVIQFERKYIKNNSYAIGSPQNSLGRRNKSTKELISRRQRKENREIIKSFIDAESEGETDTYRKSLVDEMDLQVAKMKSDGFIDDDGNDTNSVTDNIDEKIEYTVDENSGQDINDEFYHTSKNTSKFSRYKQMFEGIFSELDRNIQMIQDDCKIKMAPQSIRKQSYESEENFNSNDSHTKGNGNMEDDQNIPLDNEYDAVCEEFYSNEEKFEDLNRSEKEETSNEDVVYENLKIFAEDTSLNNSGDTIYEEVYYQDDVLEDAGAINDTEVGLEAIGVLNDIDDDNVYVQETDGSKNGVNFSIEDDFFGSLGDDLENGSYFVEAYNTTGKELVIVEISLERRTVNFDKPFTLESIQKSMNGVDMVFHKKQDKSLNIIEDPKEFMNETANILSNGFTNDPESNRSTVYSTNSRDSDVFDTDDEGIGMGNAERRAGMDNVYNNVRRETFCDDKGIVRIERVGYPESVHFLEDGESHTSVSRNNSFAQKSKLSYIIDEIKSTEKKYVTDLHKVVKRYIPYIEKHTPPNLGERQHLIFGNIRTIWEHQKEFLIALETCEEVDDIVRTFIDFKELFKLYPRYFKNKPRADVVLREFSSVVRAAQDKFNERLDLSSYLLTPLQRLGKYKLFLENIEKQLRKLDLPTVNTSIALEIIKKEMSKGNDFVAIESIDNSPILKTEYGSFKMREIFTIARPRRFESMVFLFENIIVFTTLSNQRNSETYNYAESIKMIDLRIATFEDSTIHLTDFTKGKKVLRADRFTYVLEAKTEKIKDTWRKAIEDILWQQLYKVKENTLRLYQTNGNKRKNKISRGRTKSTGSSVFYCD